MIGHIFGKSTKSMKKDFMLGLSKEFNNERASSVDYDVGQKNFEEKI